MSHIPSIKLNNGISMPAIGLGTWSGTTPEQHDSAKPWILSALKNGYRHLDTAHGYGTEHVVGQALRESGVPREEVFVTTKLPPHHTGRVEISLDESLSRAGFDYYDLYLMHWPFSLVWREDDDPDPLTPDGEYEMLGRPNLNETWADMEKLLETGKVKAIGVANFSIKTLTQLFKTAKIIPAVNQIEMHPYLSQNELKAFTDAKGIELIAYSPTGYGPVQEDPEVVRIAKKHGVSSVQVSLAWHVARGTAAIPKSTRLEHQLQNINLPRLEQTDLNTLDSLDKNTHLCNSPGPKDRAYGWKYEQMGW